MKKINIAIDGHSACGKSTTAKAVASALQYIYVDTGAMYRAVTLYMIEHKTDLTDVEAVEQILPDIQISFTRANGQMRTILNGTDVEEQIRRPEVAARVSEVSAISAVRRKLVSLQQQMGKDKGVVMDGRDIGTVVFPDAELKIFMTARPDVRSVRRQAELLQKGINEPLESVKENLLQRDEMDSSREDSPLRQANDAVVLDTSDTSPEEQVAFVCQLAEKLITG